MFITHFIEKGFQENKKMNAKERQGIQIAKVEFIFKLSADVEK